MSKIEFGLKSEPTTALEDFQTYTSDLGGNYNPYNQSFFNNPANMAVTNDKKRITSIPSPYARMHVTDLAFREYISGNGIITINALANKVMSADYRQALSHCLDIYELIYYSDMINLKELGISLHKVNLVSSHSHDAQIQEFFTKNPSLENYVKTLDLFREEYVKVIARKKAAKGINNYEFDFTSLYVLKHNDQTFAATSPFTGFYAKSDCDLRKKDGNTSVPIITYQNHNYLTSEPKDWRGIAERDNAFKEFLYLLLKSTGLQYIFENLFTAVANSLPNSGASLNSIDFNDVQAYKKFNIAGAPLQLIGQNNAQISLRQDGIDCSYLKYLLYNQSPVELSISQDEYNVPIASRRFPKDGNINPWIGVNDLLTDALFVLSYEINDNYVTIPFEDLKDTGSFKKRCLLPITRLALDYFDLNTLIQNISITKTRNDVYVVEFIVPLSSGGTTMLRKEYRQGEEVKFPNGIVIEGENMIPFAFGIYPFIKVQNYDNIYKILFYNSFESDYSLKFYKKDADNNIIEYLSTEHEFNKTNDVNNTELPVNCEYHHLSAREGLEFVEVNLDIKGKNVSSLIIPNLRTPQNIPGRTDVAIDLGTSNTYIAYNFRPVGAPNTLNIKEINTHHGVAPTSEWNELTFMNQKCTQAQDPNAPEKNREDLYLWRSDKDKQPSSEWLPTQLLEFIPSRIDPNLGQKSYKFPIPTVINFLRQNCQRTAGNKTIIPLLHAAIPFAYYENGTREGAQPAYYDIINDGSDFKWFAKKVNGKYEVDPLMHQCFDSFMAELLFIVRSHLLSNGYPLNDCHILWSYPLSFSSLLIGEYKSAWDNAYKKYINDIPNVNQYVSYTNESRTPIYECMTNPTTINHLTLLMDIGGGSTDVIGYKNNSPQFISSFGFAGNSLYLGGSLNAMNTSSMQKSMLMRYVKEQPLFKNATTHNVLFENVTIGTDRPISEIMNYGFSKDPDNFEKLFKYNDEPNFMLLLHNAALIYHTAQLCNIKSPDEVPVDIYLTGNGSKLFDLNTDKEEMIRNIFKYVYEHSDNEASRTAAEKIKYTNLPQQSNPKAATAYGALKGIYMGTLATDSASSAGQVVLLGDSKTAYDIKANQNAVNIGADFDIKGAVKPNVEAFIEMFYSIVYTTATPCVTKDELLEYLDFIKDNGRISVPNSGLISDSMFFQYIALIMEKTSAEMK